METIGQGDRPAAAPLAPGDPPAVGRFTLHGRLGEGGMGVVFLGRDPAGAGVAVKILRDAAAADPEARGRFRAEAAFARRVAAFTARVIEDGSDQARPYIVTEYIEGPPLSDVVERDGPLAPAQVRAVAIGTAAALVVIHGAGLVHRDLKPGNVLLARSGPRIIDFGIAHPVDVVQGPTQAGVVMGSPGWIAPERLVGEPDTTAADVFGWGCLVAYAATGRHPFGVGDAQQVAGRIIHLPPDLEGLGESLRDPVEAAIGKDPSARPSAANLLESLLADRPDETPECAIARLWQPPQGVPDAPPKETGTAPGRAAPRTRGTWQRARLSDALPRDRGAGLRAGLSAALAGTAVVVAVTVAAGLDLGAGAGKSPDRVQIVVSDPPGKTAAEDPPAAGEVERSAPSIPGQGRTSPPVTLKPGRIAPPNGKAPGNTAGSPSVPPSSVPPAAPSTTPQTTPPTGPDDPPGPPGHGKPRKSKKPHPA